MDAFDLFLEITKPRIRPEGLIERVCKAMEINAHFKSEFAAVRGLVRVQVNRWADQLLLELMKTGDIGQKVPEDRWDRMRELVEAHGKDIIAGQFDEDNFRTMEEMTLFFVYHGVQAVWISAALKRTVLMTMEDMLRMRGNGGRVSMMLVLTNFLVLELDQVQRVYIIYRSLKDEAA